jgi:hypothetical protein
MAFQLVSSGLIHSASMHGMSPENSDGAYSGPTVLTAFGLVPRVKRLWVERPLSFSGAVSRQSTNGPVPDIAVELAECPRVPRGAKYRLSAVWKRESDEPAASPNNAIEEWNLRSSGEPKISCAERPSTPSTASVAMRIGLPEPGQQARRELRQATRSRGRDGR